LARALNPVTGLYKHNPPDCSVMAVQRSSPFVAVNKPSTPAIGSNLES
jgi:hypothetical protein